MTSSSSIQPSSPSSAIKLPAGTKFAPDAAEKLMALFQGRAAPAEEKAASPLPINPSSTLEQENKLLKTEIAELRQEMKKALETQKTELTTVMELFLQQFQKQQQQKYESVLKELENAKNPLPIEDLSKKIDVLKQQIDQTTASKETLLAVTLPNITMVLDFLKTGLHKLEERFLEKSQGEKSIETSSPKALQDHLNGLDSKLEEFSKILSTKADADKSHASHEELKVGIQSLQKSIKDRESTSRADLSGFNERLDELSKSLAQRIQKLENELETQIAKHSDLQKKIEPLTKKQNDLVKTVSEVQKKVDDSATLLNEMSQTVDKVSQADRIQKTQTDSYHEQIQSGGSHNEPLQQVLCFLNDFQQSVNDLRLEIVSLLESNESQASQIQELREQVDKITAPAAPLEGYPAPQIDLTDLYTDFTETTLLTSQTLNPYP